MTATGRVTAATKPQLDALGTDLEAIKRSLDESRELGGSRDELVATADATALARDIVTPCPSTARAFIAIVGLGLGLATAVGQIAL